MPMVPPNLAQQPTSGLMSEEKPTPANILMAASTMQQLGRFDQADKAVATPKHRPRTKR